VGKRHPNPRLVKIHRCYSVEEIARLFGIHKNTVRAWLKQGLDAIDNSRPILVHGKGLASFLAARRLASKRPCPPGHIYCLRCRAPKPPAGNMVDYALLAASTGNVSAICPTCGSMMYRRVNKARLWEFSGKAEVTNAEASPRIKGSDGLSVNCDIDKVGQL
jgi:hypothetical protein